MSRRRRTKPTLPPSCSECRPYDGAWRLADGGGFERCYCPRGRALLHYRRGKPKPQAPLGFDGKMAGTGEDKP